MHKPNKAHKHMMDLAQSFLMKRFYISLLWRRNRRGSVMPCGHVKLEQNG